MTAVSSIRWPERLNPIVQLMGESRLVQSKPGRQATRLIRGFLGSQVGRFAVIGVFATLAYLVIYALLRVSLSAQFSNALALLLTTFGNTLANRRLTFGAHPAASAWRDQAVGLIGLAAALAITSGALALLAALGPGAGRLLEMAVLVAANGLATVVRFLLLRAWMVARTGPQLIPVVVLADDSAE